MLSQRTMPYEYMTYDSAFDDSRFDPIIKREIAKLECWYRPGLMSHLL